MPQPIDARLVEARMRDLALASVSQTISLFKGGVFALAAVLLLEIALSPADRLVLLVLWTSSFCLTLVTYNAYINASVIIFRENVPDVVVIIVQMMLELMLFAVLTPRMGEQVWRYWILVRAAHALATAVRLSLPLNRGVSFDASLKPLLSLLGNTRRLNARLMIVLFLVAAALSVPILRLPRDSVWPWALTLGFGLFVLTIETFALFQMHRQRLAMERLLEQTLAGSHAG